ncbi:MAG: trypsin-like peptidase domain-containing protein [Oscillospiraceae bacterium]|nr:trypsin-like peptidase domain-containing protein [Oscillospiraceae bacterium]
MKKFVAAVLSAVICLGTLAVPVTASAYDKMDLNKDGKVNIMDTIYINRYLMGQHYVPDYNRLDVDNSMTIDCNDANCLLATVVQMDYSTYYYSKKTGNYTPVSRTVSTAGVYPVTGSRTYARYSYKTGKKLSNYTLTLTSKQDSTNEQRVEPYTIFSPTDSRKNLPGDENRGIVRVGNGTGFIVGDHQIATAAHCVSSQKNGTFYAKPEIQLYDKSGKLTGGTLTAIEAHVPTLYFVEGNHPDYDYALITVAEDLSSYPHFEIAETYNLSESGFANVPINITGCPGSVNGPNTNHLLFTAEGRVASTVEGCRYSLRTNVDMSGGDSGAPVYTIIATAQGTNIEYSFVVLGINAYEGTGYNFGSRFDRFHRQFYSSNPNMSTS